VLISELFILVFQVHLRLIDAYSLLSWRAITLLFIWRRQKGIRIQFALIVICIMGLESLLLQRQIIVVVEGAFILQIDNLHVLKRC
jgi:hypothetical protein